MIISLYGLKKPALGISFSSPGGQGPRGGIMNRSLHIAQKPEKTVMRPRSIRTVTGTQPAGLGSMLADRREMDELFSVTYEELRRLASTVKRNDPSATFTPTALVNQAWLKLANSPRFATTSPLHFKRIAARAMRQVLVEAARRRSSYKRAGS